MAKPDELKKAESHPDSRLAKGPKPPERRDKEKQGARTKRAESQADICEKLTDTLLKSVPAVDEKEREQKLNSARKSISDALLFLKYLHKPTREAVKKKEINFECADYYLAIAIKESGLNPMAKSYADDSEKGGLGYFQLFLDGGNIKALEAVNKRFGLSYTKDNIYPKDEKYQTIKDASKRNAIVGILYWHILRDEIGSSDAVREKRDWKLKLSAKDRDKIAAMSYNLGPSAVDQLWGHFKPESVQDFELKLAETLVKANSEYLAHPEAPSKKDDYKDSTYDTGYTVYAYEKFKLPREKGKERTTKIGDKEYRTLKLLETLRYTELIFSMMHGGPVSSKVLPKPADKPAEKPVEKPKTTPKPTPKTTPPLRPNAEFVGPPLPPDYAERPAPRREVQGRYEVIGQDRWLWSIATQFLQECQDSYKIQYCLDPSVPKKDKVEFLMEVLIKYNREIDNEDFDRLEDDHDINGIARGAKVYFPNKEYVEKTLKQSDTEVEAPKLPEVPEAVKSKGYYAGPDLKTAEKWHKEGLEEFGKAVKPTMVVPKQKVKVPKMKDGKVVKVKGKVQYEWVSKPIDTAKKGPYGKMPKEKVSGVVVHTTEGNHEGLYRNQGIHYVLRRDGTVELIRNTDLAVDHAGLMRNSRSKAMWRGDSDLSLHTVGIEVVNPALGQLVKDGEIVIEADAKKVKSKKVGKRTIYYIEQAPSEKALEAGRKMALKARDLTAKQYASLKKLLAWLGHEFNLQKRDIWTHSMVATSKFGRGRKSDPPVMDWQKLGLPDNHWQVDQDVLAGRVIPNLTVIERYRTGEALETVNIDGAQYYSLLPVTVDGKTKYTYEPKSHFGADPNISAGIQAALQIKEEEKKKKNGR